MNEESIFSLKLKVPLGQTESIPVGLFSVLKFQYDLNIVKM